MERQKTWFETRTSKVKLLRALLTGEPLRTSVAETEIVLTSRKPPGVTGQRYKTPSSPGSACTPAQEAWASWLTGPDEVRRCRGKDQQS